jgi:circadian clock protein KaiC
VLNGGLPKGNFVLLTGACGTGKTTLALETLCNAARAGEPGIFLSTTEPVSRILDNASTYRFFDKDSVGKTIHLIDAAEQFEDLKLETEFTPKNVDEALSWLSKTVADKKASRLVIDSLTGIGYRVGKRELVRDFVFRLGRELAELGCTTIATVETPAGVTSYSTFGVEEAVADGIILLGNHDARGYLLRTLQVVKMRGTVHSRARYVIDLTTHGVIMVPMLKASMRGE